MCVIKSTVININRNRFTRIIQDKAIALSTDYTSRSRFEYNYLRRPYIMGPARGWHKSTRVIFYGFVDWTVSSWCRSKCYINLRRASKLVCISSGGHLSDWQMPNRSATNWQNVVKSMLQHFYWVEEQRRKKTFHRTRKLNNHKLHRIIDEAFYAIARFYCFSFPLVVAFFSATKAKHELTHDDSPETNLFMAFALWTRKSALRGGKSVFHWSLASVTLSEHNKDAALWKSL